MDRQQKTIGVILTLGVFLASVGVVAAYSGGDLSGSLTAWRGWKAWTHPGQGLERSSDAHAEGGNGNGSRSPVAANASEARAEPDAKHEARERRGPARP